MLVCCILFVLHIVLVVVTLFVLHLVLVLHSVCVAWCACCVTLFVFCIAWVSHSHKAYLLRERLAVCHAFPLGVFTDGGQVERDVLAC